MKKIFILLFSCISVIIPITVESEKSYPFDQGTLEYIQTLKETILRQNKTEVEILKDLLFTKHNLHDLYPYKDTIRKFQWDKVEEHLIMLEDLQKENFSWAVLQNRKNKNGRAPVTKIFRKNKYNRIIDAYGREQNQSIPLYACNDSITPERYGLDGVLVKLLSKDSSGFVRIQTISFEGEWLVPKKYIKYMNDSILFNNVVFVDRVNQNIMTLEKVNNKWLVRSMNPATTGLYRPPYMYETPIGIYVIQDKKARMAYNKDGTNERAGSAPYASRFCNGAYIHGVPIKGSANYLVDFSSSLGTTPKSHMCIRNATSHAKFIYDWAPVEKSLIFVFD